MSLKIPKINSKSIKKNSSKILKIASLIGLIGSNVATAYATYKSVRACDERKRELGVEKLPVKETIKVSWKYYILPFSITAASTAGMIKGESIDVKRTEVLKAAYSAAEQTLVDYKEETRKQVGEKQEKEIERRVIENQADDILKDIYPLAIQGQEHGGKLFYEPVTGTFFFSTREKVDRAFNELSAQMIRENSVNLGDLFAYLDLKKVGACDVLGWNSSRIKIIEPDYSWGGIKDTCTPYTIMGYEWYPTSNYDEY